MSRRESLSGVQFTLLLLVSYLTAGIFTFPKEVVDAAGPAGLFSVLTTTGIATGCALTIAWLGSHFPGESAVQWSSRILGRPLAGMLVGVGLLLHTLVPAIIVRTFTEMLKETFFNLTPIWVLVIAALVVAMAGALAGVEAVARAAVVTMPATLVLMGAAYLFSMPLLELYRLRPAAVPLDAFLHGCLHAGLLYEGSASVMLLQSKLKEPQRALRYVLISFAISTVFLLLVYATTVAAFGRTTLVFLTWPAPQLLLTVRLSGWFVERLGLFVEIVWAGFVILHTAVHLWATALAGVQLVGLSPRRAYPWLVAGLTGVYLAVATLLPDVEIVHAAFRQLPWGGIYLNLLLPLLWSTVGWARGLLRVRT